MTKYSYVFALLFIFISSCVDAGKSTQLNLCYSVRMTGRGGTTPIFFRDNVGDASYLSLDFIQRVANSPEAYAELLKRIGLRRNPYSNRVYARENPMVLVVQRVEDVGVMINRLHKAQQCYKPFYTVYLQPNDIPNFVKSCANLERTICSYYFCIVPIGCANASLVSSMKQQFKEEAHRPVYNIHVQMALSKILEKRNSFVPDVARKIHSFLL